MRHYSLELDFTPRRAPVGEYALLALGLIAVGAVALLALQARADIHSAAARLQQRTAQVARVAQGATVAARRAALPAQVANALATPWSALLSDLETQAGQSGGDVALLRIEPDREHASLLLVAEARSLPSALKYVQQLQKLPSLRRAVLQSHEILQDEPEKPVRVEISANWGQGT